MLDLLLNQPYPFMKTTSTAKLLASLILFSLSVINVSAQPFGNALSFTEASKSYVTTNTTLGNFGTGDFTIELWANTTSINTGIFFSKRASCGSALNFITGGITNSKLFLEVAGNNYNVLNGTSTSIIDGKWHHVAFVRKGNTASIYLDGKLEAGPLALVGAPSISNTAIFAIGSSPLCPHWYTGSMDEMRIYKKALAESAIAADMYSPVAFVSADMLASYNFDQGIAEGTNTGLTVLNDQSGNNNTGTLTSFGLAGPTSNWIKSYAVTSPAIASSIGQTFAFSFQTSASDSLIYTGLNGASFAGKVNYRPTVMPVSCTLDKLYILGTMSNANGSDSSNTISITVYKNGAVTGMTAAITVSAVGETVMQSDLLHPVTVLEGDKISLGFKQTNGKPFVQMSIAVHAQ